MDQNQIKTPTANETIIRMLQAINQDKREVVYKIAEDYLAGLSSSGSTAQSLKSLLRHKPYMMHQLTELPHDLKKLLRIEPLVEVDILLPDDLMEQVEMLLLEWANADAFAAYNLPIRSKILLHGKSGNGKTTFARHIAQRSGLPFYEVKSAQIVQSHLGDTGRNVEKLFESLSGKAVVFYDEIDSIALTRKSSRSDHEEISRSLNVMLVHMEKLSQDIVFIGATNRFSELDPAIIRRFDAVIELPIPTQSDRVRYLSFLADLHNFQTSDERNFFHSLDYLESYSDLKRGFLQVLRDRVIHKIRNKELSL